jgi:hypothetical protein
MLENAQDDLNNNNTNEQSKEDEAKKKRGNEFDIFFLSLFQSNGLL